VKTGYDELGTLKEKLRETLVYQAYLRTSRKFLRLFIEEQDLEELYRKWRIKRTEDFNKIENYYLQEIEQKMK